MNLYKNYYYRLFKYYSKVIKQDEGVSKFASILMIVVFFDFNLIAILSYLDIFFNNLISNIIFENNLWLPLYVIFSLIIFTFNIMFLSKKRKHEKIVELFKEETKNQIMIRSILVISYFILTFAALILLVQIYPWESL